MTQRSDRTRSALTVTPGSSAGATAEGAATPTSGTGGSTEVRGGSRAGTRAARAAPGGARTGPRRARLVLRRVDPWSALKLSLVLSLALFVVGLVAVAVLYGVLEGMGVPQAVNETLSEVTAGAGGEEGIGDVLTLRRVLTVAAVVGLVNAVLITALATLSAFLYNLCADVVGGVDLTLSERD